MVITYEPGQGFIELTPLSRRHRIKARLFDNYCPNCGEDIA